MKMERKGICEEELRRTWRGSRSISGRREKVDERLGKQEWGEREGNRCEKKMLDAAEGLEEVKVLTIGCDWKRRLVNYLNSSRVCKTVQSKWARPRWKRRKLSGHEGKEVWPGASWKGVRQRTWPENRRYTKKGSAVGTKTGSMARLRLKKRKMTGSGGCDGTYGYAK